MEIIQSNHYLMELKVSQDVKFENRKYSSKMDSNTNSNNIQFLVFKISSIFKKDKYFIIKL